MKKERHQLIRQIIEVQNIETQEDLAKALLERGYNVTQATVSRNHLFPRRKFRKPGPAISTEVK